MNPSLDSFEKEKIMSKDKFYKTTVTFTILSEDPIGDIGLGDLANVEYACTDGDYVGNVDTKSETIDAAMAANLLNKYGSDPGFFMLDDDGNKVDDDRHDDEADDSEMDDD